jgi:hypothetical protein
MVTSCALLQIPPSLPLLKGGIPLFGKEGAGEIGSEMSIQYGLIRNIISYN